MGPFWDPPLGVQVPGIRRVARRLYLADNHFMYNAALAGMRLHYVPDDDVAALARLTGRFEFGAFCVAVAVVGGIVVRAWSVWWCGLAVAAVALVPLTLGRHVSERYPAVTDPAIARAARARAALDQPPLGATIAMSLLSVLLHYSTVPTAEIFVLLLAGAALAADLARVIGGRRALRNEDGVV